MKKVLAVILASFLALSGCNTEETNKPNNTQNQPEAKQPKTEKVQKVDSSNPTVEKSSEIQSELSEEEKIKKEEEEAIKRHAESPLSQITTNGGLGDHIKAFEKNYGPNTGDDMFGVFQNSNIGPMFLYGRANNVTVQFEATNQPRRTKAEAIGAFTNIIPTDSVKVKEWSVEDSDLYGKDIIQFESKLLAEVFKNEISVFGGANPGTFIAILKRDKNGYFTVVLGTGNNP